MVGEEEILVVENGRLKLRGRKSIYLVQWHCFVLREQWRLPETRQSLNSY